MNFGSHINWINFIYVHVYTISKQLLYIMLKIKLNYLSKFIPTQARFSACEEFDYLYIMHANIPNVFKKLPL